ncbi:MAG: hypothetical protein JNL28_03255 [Planctomycetes bacterium]|nr:hypothetical protein [Planctomycetota bacterium]
MFPAVLLALVAAHATPTSAGALQAVVAEAQAGAPIKAAATQRSARGAHFLVVAHWDSQASADTALAAAEAVVPFAESIFGQLAPVGAVPIQIHLFASAAALAASEHARSHGAHALEGSFVCDESGSAFVAARPELDAVTLDLIGLPLPTRFDVAQAAFEACARRAWTHAARLPGWLYEGAAIWAAEEAVAARHWAKERDEEPGAATRTLRAQVLLANGALPEWLALIEGVPAGLTRDERRAVLAQWFRFLKTSEQAPLLARLVDAARRSGAEADAQAFVARAARTAVARDAAGAALQTGFEDWLRARAPAWQELHGALWPLGNVWAQAAGRDHNALTWRVLPPASSHYELKGELTILPGATRQANVLLGRAADAFVQVAFIADYGIDVFRFSAAPGKQAQWKKLATVAIPELTEGTQHAFKLVAHGARLVVWLADKPVLALDVPENALDGAFGLGAYAGSACLWRELALKELE